MLKKTAKLSKNELTKVAGGSIKETKELMEAFSKVNTEMNAYFYGPDGLTDYQVFATHLEKALKNDFNVDARVSVGWNGTGLRETKNTYSINGKSLSHQDVLNMIKAA